VCAHATVNGRTAFERTIQSPSGGAGATGPRGRADALEGLSVSKETAVRREEEWARQGVGSAHEP